MRLRTIGVLTISISALLVTVLACVPRRPISAAPAGTTLLASDYCFDSAAGVTIYAQAPTKCPAQLTVDTVLAAFLKDTAVAHEELRWTQVSFVGQPISCNILVPDEHGCADGTNMIVQMTEHWPADLRHQLGHIVAVRRVADFDYGHNRCLFWNAVDQHWPDSVRLRDPNGYFWIRCSDIEPDSVLL